MEKKELKSINIKGKDYVMVNERLMAFREEHPEYSLVSELVSCTGDSCIFKASIIDENGVVRATGHAQEDKSSSMINKTSYIENCETSAWGRALGNFGYGIGSSIASAEEVSMAIAKQELQDEVLGGSFLLQGGKYDGKTIQEVYDIDKNYCVWCSENSKSFAIRQNFKKCLIDNGYIPEVNV